MSQHEFGPLPEGPLSVDTKGKFNALKFKLQSDLMMEYMKERETTDDTSEVGLKATQEWVALYSDKFRNIFHRKVATDPHFKEDIKTIPDAVYEAIKIELYHDDKKVEPQEYIDYDINESGLDTTKAA